MLNSPKTTLWHWISLVTWILLLAGILFFLLIGPGRHDGFDKFSTGIVLTFGGLTIVGTFCICCYMGFDGFKKICFGTKLDKDGRELMENPPRQENTQRRLLELQGIEETEDVHSEKISNNLLPDSMKSLSLDSKVYRKSSTTPNEGPFTVEEKSNGSLEVVAHKLSRVDSLSYQREFLYPKPKRQKRSLNWYEEENNTRNLADSVGTLGERSPKKFSKRTRTVEMQFSTRSSNRDNDSPKEKKVSQCLSDIPEPFEYKTPEKKNSIGSNYHRL